MKRSEYFEHRYKYSQMDPDYVVDVLNISSMELLDAFPKKFVQLLKDEYESEEEEPEEGSYGRPCADEGP